VLYALPKAVEELNVTMGYPLKHTALYTLSECWIRLQINGRGKESKRYLNGEDLFAFLSHPTIHALAPKECQRTKVLLKRIKQPWVAVETLLEKITHRDIVEAFAVSETTDQLLERLLAFLLRMHQSSNSTEVVQQEFSYHYIKHLTQFKEQLRHHHLNITGATLLRLLRDTFTTAKVAFSGEPLTGLQIMGFLETRSLDFEHLYILSVNEKKLPAGKRSNSYIPFALRKIFKLPTFEEQDAISAYHFHRVIQRATTVTLLYDTEVAVDGSGEKSRFIRQLEYYVKGSTDSNVSWNESIYHLPLSDYKDPVRLSIRKTPEVLQSMSRFLVLPDQETKGLAPTSLTTYIECSLRFYFQYVAQLPERRAYSQDMEPRDFGSLTHRALELIYAPYLNKTITPGTIEELMNPENLEGRVKEAFQSYYKLEQMPSLEGRNLLQERIIQRLVLKVLEHDKSEAPFIVVGLEDELQQIVQLGQHKVALRGSLDRIPRSVKGEKEIVKIVDYKTGRVELVRNRSSQAKPWSLDDYMKQYFTDSRYKSGFQSYFYAYLWHRAHKTDSILAGIFGLKKSSEGVQWLQQGAEISEPVLSKFDTNLKELLTEIFDPKIPFSQTEDLKKCMYCPYKDICQR
ncbi:MAG: PD-(D/E)XK nuclease family protein, partial [Cyclobacteriaceae bacterium]